MKRLYQVWPRRTMGDDARDEFTAKWTVLALLAAMVITNIILGVKLIDARHELREARGEFSEVSNAH